ncbi:MAG: urease accessory protein UreE [Pseudomonadota bacterium]
MTPDSRLVLSFEQRSRSRLRAQLEDNRDVAVALKRGSRLFPGDILESDSGEHIVVVAAKEKVSEVQSTDHLSLARICYHLGNRHVALQIGEGFLRYLNDHVLDDMVERLGLKVIVKDDVFEPESGAYGEHAHVHSH